MQASPSGRGSAPSASSRGSLVHAETPAQVARTMQGLRESLFRTWMIVTPGTQPTKAQPQRDANDTLVEAVAKACRWQELIESGQYASLEDLAKGLKLDRSYVGRILRLT